MTAGMELDYFWDSTYANITLKLQAYSEQRHLDSICRATESYILSQMIGETVCTMLFSKDAKVPPIEKFYPHLFNEEINQPVEEQPAGKGKLSKAEMAFLHRMIEEKNRQNKLEREQQNNKE